MLVKGAVAVVVVDAELVVVVVVVVDIVLFIMCVLREIIAVMGTNTLSFQRSQKLIYIRSKKFVPDQKMISIYLVNSVFVPAQT